MIASRVLGTQIATSLEVWIIADGERFAGDPPPPPLASAILALAQRAAVSGIPQSEEVELAGDEGAPLRAFRLVARHAPGGGVAVASLALDALREAGDTLSRHERLMEATLDAAWDWDVVSGKTWWNRRQYEVLGYDPGSTAPSFEAWVSRLHPEDRDKVLQGVHEAFASGSTRYQDEYRFVRTDGSIGVALDRAYIERDASGQPQRAVGVMSDVTVERHLEQQLAHAQRMESIGRLAGGIAHDFNNLLTVVLSSAQVLLGRLPAEDLRRADLERIKEAGDRAARLTAQLLLFARRKPIAPATVDLNDLAQNMERLLRRVIGATIELKTELAPDLGAVWADRAQLEQVLVNLAINARDAMPNGGRLTIETRNLAVGAEPTAGHTQLAPGDYVVLVVRDSGGGIPSDVLPHIFEPFYTSKPAGQGTGLGLATCHGIVHRAGGDILVDTVVGDGTTFTIVLPRTSEPAGTTEHRPRPVLTHGSETVLFVDDDPGVRKVGVMVLREQNYQVLEAADGTEALLVAAAHQGPIHLMITDVVMPAVSGVEVARILVQQRPDIRVLFTSGYTDDTGVHQGASRSGFLPKPYVADTLLEHARALLDGAD